MIGALRALRKIERDRAAMAEVPVALLRMAYVNANRDTTKHPEPLGLDKFLLYAERTGGDGGIPAEAAAVALELQHQGKCPAVVVGIWPSIVEAARPDVAVPPVRALRSDDDALWVLAPRWEQGHIRGALVAATGSTGGTVVLRDLDRPLLTYRVQMPERQGGGWIEAGLLLLSAGT